jgi:Flp pilus assembly protein CpaB
MGVRKHFHQPEIVEDALMKPKTMILMVVAVVCGLAASYMTSRLLAERKAPPQEERVPVVVSKTKVPRFTTLNEPEKYFEVKWRVKTDVPLKYFSELKDIKDKRVNKEFKPDVYIEPEDVLDKTATVLSIPDGHGAIGIKVTAASTAGYFVTPGDKVDLLLTQRGEQSTASTILWDVLVLASGDKIAKVEESSSSSGSIQAQTVTLALKNDDATLVRLAETVGEISLLLKKDGDRTQARTDRITTLDDLKRAGRGLNFAASLTPTAPVDPNKLPFGWGVDELKKPEKKTDEEESKKVEPIKPVWSAIVVRGYAPEEKVHFYAQPDGGVAKDAHPADAKKDEKDEKVQPKKDEPKK